jgi:hypothetical protein
MDERLSRLASDMITSFVYSHDVVSRLSLGSIRDMNRAAAWLCKAQAEGRPEGYSGVTKRALKYNTGFGTADDPFWVSLLVVAQRIIIEHKYPSSFLCARLWRRICL